MLTLPDYTGGSLVNLMAELELRLTGTAPSPGLHRPLADAIPDAESYVVVLFDGLGDHQLAHSRAETLASCRVGAIDAPFPTTTIVAMSSIATGLAPAGHGIVSHFLSLEDVGVVNALKWTKPGGKPTSVDTAALLPGPNLWERLAAAGREPITVQPANFEGSSTTSLLYRGCRFEGATTERQLIEITCDLAREPGRLILTYLPHVDLAAHVAGQDSHQYAEAMRIVDTAWSDLLRRLPDGAVAIGTADHGHIDYDKADKQAVPRAPGRLFGDPRGLMVRGPLDEIRTWAEPLPGTLIDEVRPLFGPGVHPGLGHRLPDAVLIADPGKLLLPRYMDDRLVGYHGGLDDRERRIPLLVA